MAPEKSPFKAPFATAFALTAQKDKSLVRKPVDFKAGTVWKLFQTLDLRIPILTPDWQRLLIFPADVLGGKGESLLRKPGFPLVKE